MVIKYCLLHYAKNMGKEMSWGSSLGVATGREREGGSIPGRNKRFTASLCSVQTDGYWGGG
jgi:hypothetical protein